MRRLSQIRTPACIIDKNIRIDTKVVRVSSCVQVVKLDIEPRPTAEQSVMACLSRTTRVLLLRLATQKLLQPPA